MLSHLLASYSSLEVWKDQVLSSQATSHSLRAGTAGSFEAPARQAWAQVWVLCQPLC